MFKAIVFFSILAFIFLFTLFFCPPIAIHFLYFSYRGTRKEYTKSAISFYGHETFIAYDQLLNVLLSPFWNWLFNYPIYKFGFADETMSSVFGKNILRMPTHCCKAMFIIDDVLTRIDQNSDAHCKESIEEDEGNI